MRAYVSNVLEMYDPLYPCSSCARHVRAAEKLCPFCGVELPDERVVLVGRPRQRLTRATFMFGASIAAATLSSPAGADAGPPEDASVGPTDDGGDADAGVPDGGPDDPGGVSDIYGAPPACDCDIGDAPGSAGYAASLLALGAVAAVRRRR